MTRGASSPRRWALALAGLAVSALFLALAARGVDVARVTAALGRARLFPWLPLAVGSYLAGHVARGLRCRRLVSREFAVTRTTACNVVVLGYAVNNILPARLGELARAGMLSERTGMPYVQSLAVTFLERLLDGIVVLVAFEASVALLPAGPALGRGAAVAGLVFAGATLAVALVLLAPALPRWAISRALGGRGPLHDAAIRAVTSVTQGASPLRDPRVAIPVVALSFFVWLCEAGLFAFLLPAFGLPLALPVGLLAMSMTNLSVLLPSTPGFVGVFHYWCAAALSSQGTEADVALAYATTVHLAFFVPVTVWGVGVLLGWGVELGRTLDLVGKARASAPIDAALARAEVRVVAQFVASRPVETPGRFLSALVAAHLEWDDLAVSAADRARVEARVAAFVEGQISALAAPLDLAFRVGLVALRALFVVTTLRDLASASPEARAATVERWANGPIPPVRQLLRAIRANALLAFYDDPIVTAALSARDAPVAPVRLPLTAEGA